jgi:hypothetical protein
MLARSLGSCCCKHITLPPAHSHNIPFLTFVKAFLIYITHLRPTTSTTFRAESSRDNVQTKQQPS